jgi:hypothetical protein
MKSPKSMFGMVPKSIAIAIFLSIGAFAQQAAEQPAVRPTPPQMPIFTPTELAAKVPTPNAADVNSLDGIMRAIYQVISGPAGDRDWQRFRSLFLPQARFTQVGKQPDGSTFVISWSVDEFVRDAGLVFAKEPFYENAIVNQSESFGNMTQVFSSYESRHAPSEKPFERGINTIQILNDGTRWWVISIAWDSEKPGNPLPKKFAAKGK